MGSFDYVRECLDAFGFQARFWTVAVRPGSPATFGMVGHVPVFSLPGNPVASMVTFELFVRPALRKMTGRCDLFRPRLERGIAGCGGETPWCADAVTRGTAPGRGAGHGYHHGSARLGHSALHEPR